MGKKSSTKQEEVVSHFGNMTKPNCENLLDTAKQSSLMQEIETRGSRNNSVFERVLKLLVSG